MSSERLGLLQRQPSPPNIVHKTYHVTPPATPPITPPPTTIMTPTPPRPRRQAISDAVSALMAFLMLVVLNVVFVSAIFIEGLHSAIGEGMNAAVQGTIISGCVALLFGSIPYVCAGPDLTYTPFMALMVETIHAHQRLSEEAKFATFAVVIVMSITLCGALLWLSGKLRLLRLAEFLPLPVICGILAGIGLLVLRLCWNLTPGWHILPTACIGACIFAVFKLRGHPAVIMPTLALSVVAFYVLNGIGKGDVARAREQGWLFSPETFDTRPSWLLRTALVDAESHSGIAPDWGAVLACMPQILAMAALALLKNSLMLLALEKSLGLRLGVNQELKVLGVAHLISGALGTFASAPMTAANLLVRDLGGSRYVPSIAALVALAACCLTSFSFVTWVPKFAFTSVLFGQAVGLLHDWIVLKYALLNFDEWAIIVCIAFTMFQIGLLSGVVMGIIFSTLLFAQKFLSIPVIKFKTSAQSFRSSKDRWLGEAELLDMHGAQIVMLQLQGYLFFGNTATLHKSVRNCFQAADRHGKASRTETVSTTKANGDFTMGTLILDFSLVYGADGSATAALQKVMEMLAGQGAELICSTVRTKAVARALQHARAATQCKVFMVDDFDAAFSRAEDRLIGAVSTNPDLTAAGASPDPTGRGPHPEQMQEQQKPQGFRLALQRIRSRHADLRDNLTSLDLLESMVTVYELEAGHMLPTIEKAQLLRGESGGGSGDDLTDPALNGLYFVESGVVSVHRAPVQDASRPQGATASAVPDNPFSVRSVAKGDILALNAQIAANSTVGPGWVIGAEDVAQGRLLLGGCRAETRARVHFLSLAHINRIESENPALAIQIHKLVAYMNSCISNRIKLKLHRISEAFYELPEGVQ